MWSPLRELPSQATWAVILSLPVGAARIACTFRVCAVRQRGFMSIALRSFCLGATLAALLAGCSGSSKSPTDENARPASAPNGASDTGAAADAEKVVNVYNWSDYI